MREETCKAKGYLLLMVVMLLFMCFPLKAEDKGRKYPGFWLSFAFTSGKINVGDINNCITSFNNNELFSYVREFNPEWGKVQGEITPLSGKYTALIVTLFIDISPNITLSFSTQSPVRQSNFSSLIYQYTGSYGIQRASYFYGARYEMLFPLEFICYFNIIELNRVRFSIGAGSGFYYAKISKTFIRELMTVNGGYAKATMKHDAHRLPFPDLIVDLNLLTEYSLNNNSFLFSELCFRYGNLSNFRGTGSLTHVIDSEVITDYKWKGKLYFFNIEDQEIGVRYNNIEVWSFIPDGSPYFIENVRKAKLGLTGFSFRIGLKIRF